MMERDPYEIEEAAFVGPAIWPGAIWARRCGRIGLYLMLTLLAAGFLFPLFWMVLTALKTETEAALSPPVLFPVEPQWGNFTQATRIIPFWTYFANTIYLCVLNIVGAVLSSALVAYGFSRIKWPGRDLFFAVTLATMMIPFPVLLVPLYSIFLKWGWIGTFKPLWVPAFFGTAYYIFLLRQFFLTVPVDLTEAARIDGCSELRIFWQIFLPQARPALMIVGLFSFLFVWNDFMGPLIYLTDREMFTLSLGLWEFHARIIAAPANIVIAAAALMFLPVMLLFVLFHETFMRGVSARGAMQ